MDRVNELIKRVRLLRPIDDAMFKKLAESREVCQEILRVILDIRRQYCQYIWKSSNT